MIDKSLTGTRLAEFEFPVERGKIREFAGAIRDPNPVYRDPDHARASGFADVLMPVTFPVSFPLHLDSDNFILDMADRLGLDKGRSLHGECEIEHYRPVCAGETLRAEIVVGDMYEKEGQRGGLMTIVDMEIRFFDGQDRPVLLIRNKMLERA
ncbi:MAG: MaoC family dehydratase N-terminal domain-containing protein [Proteobacteria bacterium]|nr:MaoC family dehydratase N-terminal domain-containing protein [Pseudomonadota bacterium]